MLLFRTGIRKRRRKSPGHLNLALPFHAPFEGLRDHHFQFRKTEYRIAYRVREEKRQVEVVLVKSRERLYDVLARFIRLRE